MKTKELPTLHFKRRRPSLARAVMSIQLSRRQRAAFLTFLVICAVVSFVIFETHLVRFSRTDWKIVQRKTTTKKVYRNITILMWVPFFRWTFGQEQLSSCTELNCRITHERKELKRAEAVIFHDQNIQLSDLPERRLSDQHFIFFLLEPPYALSSATSQQLNTNFYTLTMTYRRDSDVHFPYGYFNRRGTPRPSSFWENFKKLVALKTKLVAWFVSNCNTRSARELYVKQLQRYIPVDVYGKCGSLLCPPEGPLCNETAVLQKYKFYISFENSVCADYVTEKYFNRLNNYVVPIVFNRKIYEVIGPNNSFIAVDDFNSSKELADYLKRLDKDDKQYLRHFEWMDMAESSGAFTNTNGICNLCRKLQQRKAGEKVTASETAKNVVGWYRQPGTCYDEYGRNVHKFYRR